MGGNDAPEIVSEGTNTTGLVFESVDAAPQADDAPVAATGTIAFSDVDLTDQHSAEVVSESVDPAGTNVQLSQDQEDALLAAFSLGQLDQGLDEVT